MAPQKVYNNNNNNKNPQCIQKNSWPSASVRHKPVNLAHHRQEVFTKTPVSLLNIQRVFCFVFLPPYNQNTIVQLFTGHLSHIRYLLKPKDDLKHTGSRKYTERYMQYLMQYVKWSSYLRDLNILGFWCLAREGMGNLGSNPLVVSRKDYSNVLDAF